MTATRAGQPARDPEDGGPAEASRDLATTEAVFDTRPVPGSATAERIAALRARLISPLPEDRLWGWIGPLIVTLFAGILRFNRLSLPNAVIFDETYYAKDAWSILKHGVEWYPIASPSNNSNYLNNLIISSGGHANIFQPCPGTGCAEFVVQPPVGKLLIAVGEWFYGLTTLGWRFAAAVVGTLAILVMCRVARRLTRSTLLGCVAGLLLSLDGLEFVLSRTGILDIFLMFFVLAAFGCLVVDRDVSRIRLAELAVLRPTDESGPSLGIRKWRVAAGILIGLATATKQDGGWYVIGFICLCIAWDMGARRTVGLRRPVRGAFVRDGKWLLLSVVVIPFVTYVLSWLGWLVTSTGYDRDYAQGHGVSTPVISPLYSLYEYHKEIIQFMIHLNSTHPYMSQPWDWFVISRPVAFYWESFTNAAATAPVTKTGAPPGNWVQEVLAIGNPAIWWVSVPAIVFCFFWWLTRRDWRAGVGVWGVAAGWLPWLPFVSRTKFYYYALEFEPFIIICIVLCLGLMIGPAAARLSRRVIGTSLAGVYVLAVLILFWYFYPILTGQTITYHDWLDHMWYTGLLGPASGWI